MVVLGSTGRNFAAGMSGGIAWVYDQDGQFRGRCNTELVGLEALTDPDEIQQVRALIERHRDLTGSARAAEILADWAASAARFVRVIPDDYRRMLEAQARMRAQGMSDEEAQLAAFEENERSPARVGGS